MSNPQPIFDALDAHTVPVFALCGLAMLGNYIWFFAALKVAKAHRTYPIPVFLTFFWFAHDSSFVARYNTWFRTYHHWFPKLFWVLLIFTVAFEIAFIVQTLKYAKDELAPTLSVWQYRLGLLGGCAAMIVAWTWLKQSMDDPIYLDIFALTVLSYPGSAIISVLRHGSRRGMSLGMCGGFLMMTVCYFTASTFFFGPHFQTPTYILVGLSSLVMALVMTWLVIRAPEYDPAAARDYATV
ncbi:hypothetical protein [Nocardia miyunensis]|uniref:hypothetical protein n=1 Tax=Nocardia miyunensis TaxID=282684 RepID=UPI00082B4585|nr:hypothetical protein [Nocardia miyunensis]